MSGPTDENAPPSGSAVPAEDAEPDPDDAYPPDRTATPGEDPGEGPHPESPEESAHVTRPCAYCGRPIEQAAEGSPAVRYCPDNEGACARAAAGRRARDQDTPGLAGQVARTWDLVERLEDVAELLALSLTGGLSVAGVERRLAEARADAATGLADAHREREAARLESEQAFAQLGAVRDHLRRATAEVTGLTAQLESARADRDLARDLSAQATRTAEAANTAITAVREERDRLMGRVVELTATLDLVRGQLAGAKEAQRRSMALEETRTRLRATESELDKMRTTAEIAQKARAAAEQACAEADRQALEARSHAEEMNAERDDLIAERDSLAADLKSCRAELAAAAPRLAAGEQLLAELEQQQSRMLEQQLLAREQAQMVDQLRGALATMLTERDAARAEAERVRSRAEAEIERARAEAELANRGPRHARPPEFTTPAAPGAPAADGSDGTQPPGRFPAHPSGPFPPGHDLGGVNGPPESFRRFLPPSED